MATASVRPSGGQGWQFYSLGGVDAAIMASTKHPEVVKPSTTSSQQIKQTAYPNQQDNLQIPISSTDGLVKKDGWQYWALGDQLVNHDDPDNNEPSSTLDAAMGEATTNAASKKGWKYWAIGLEDDQEPDDQENTPQNDVCAENLHRDHPIAVELHREDSREDECAWRFWSQMHQQHREEPQRRRSFEFDSKEAWRFWAIGLSDNASQISLLTEGFEVDHSIVSSPSVKIVKIKNLMVPIEPLDEIGWRYWSSTMKKDQAMKKSKNESTKNKQGWQFWAIGGVNNKKASMDREFIASERFEVEQPTPRMTPVAPTMAESTEDVTGMTATTNQDWQFWAIASDTNQQDVDIPNESKPRSRHNSVESLDESGLRYWSQIEEDSDLTTVNTGKKQGWQFYALGVSGQSATDVKSALSEGGNHPIDPPAMHSSQESTEDASSRADGGWKYWSRIKEDNHEDLLEREDSLCCSPFPDIPRHHVAFSANPKFYSLKSSNSLSRIEEERPSGDDFSYDDDLRNMEPNDSQEIEKSSEAAATVPNLEESAPPSQDGQSSSTINTSAQQEVKSTIAQRTKATTTTIQEEVSNTLQNLKKSLPSFETQKEKLFASDKKPTAPSITDETKNEEPERIIPKRGILPKDWIHKKNQLKQKTQTLVSNQQDRYHQEASRLYEQAQERKRKLQEQQQRLQDDLVDFEDVLLKGIAVTATKTVGAFQFAASFFSKSDAPQTKLTGLDHS